MPDSFRTERGFRYPFRFTPALSSPRSTEVNTAEVREHIKMSVEQILRTIVGSRAMRRNFGSGVHSLLFEPINGEGILLEMSNRIKRTLVAWEKRIVVERVTPSADKTEGSVTFEIEYRIIGEVGTDTYTFKYLSEIGDVE